MYKIALLFLLAMSAGANTVTFSVTATNGPIPAVIDSEVKFEDQEFLTITVEPDSAVENSINPLVDALIDYNISSSIAEVNSCPSYPCGGFWNYQITGPWFLDSGSDGSYGGTIPDLPDEFDPIGSPSGVLYVEAGTWTFTALAITDLEGSGATTNASQGSITGNFTVAEGDVALGAPEPGLWPFSLLLLVSLLMFSRYRRALD
jgi:hypothetical protein